MHTSYNKSLIVKDEAPSYLEVPAYNLLASDTVWISCNCKTSGFHKIDHISINPNKEYINVHLHQQSFDPAIKCRARVIFYRYGTAIIKSTNAS